MAPRIQLSFEFTRDTTSFSLLKRKPISLSNQASSFGLLGLDWTYGMENFLWQSRQKYLREIPLAPYRNPHPATSIEEQYLHFICESFGNSSSAFEP
jgi:hypothetical protein